MAQWRRLPALAPPERATRYLSSTQRVPKLGRIESLLKWPGHGTSVCARVPCLLTVALFCRVTRFAFVFVMLLGGSRR